MGVKVNFKLYFCPAFFNSLDDYMFEIKFFA